MRPPTATMRSTLSSMPKHRQVYGGAGGGGAGDAISGHPPSRLVVVGGVSDTQRFLKTAGCV